MISRGRLVVDANVVAKWYVPEAGSPQAAAILEGGRELLAPDLLVAEVGNVLRKKVGRGELTVAEAEARAIAFVSTSPVTLYPSAPLLGTALHLALRFQRTAYDSLYLALAVAEDVQLVTADARLAHALHGSELEELVILLGGS